MAAPELLFTMDPGTIVKTKWKLSAVHGLPGLAMNGAPGGFVLTSHRLSRLLMSSRCKR